METTITAEMARSVKVTKIAVVQGFDIVVRESSEK
jgi:hypothetical protein